MQSNEGSSAIKPKSASIRSVQLVVGAIILAIVSGAIGYLIATQSNLAAKEQLISTGPQAESGERQATVAANGAQVMPFDLSKTTHTFTDNSSGGIEMVTAIDPNDYEQVSLIRTHLQREANNFSKGDFSDPAATHGKDMPGLAELEAGAGRIAVTYRELLEGAQLIYTSSDPVLVEALHDWFEAQRADHGTSEQMNMDANTTPRTP